MILFEKDKNRIPLHGRVIGHTVRSRVYVQGNKQFSNDNNAEG